MRGAALALAIAMYAVAAAGNDAATRGDASGTPTAAATATAAPSGADTQA